MAKTALFSSIRGALARRRRTLACIAVLIVAAGAGWGLHQRDAGLERRLMAGSVATSGAMPKDVVRFASRKARPLYRRYCAECHGAALEGRPGTGAPSLKDAVWLYGDGVHRIERDILWGLRSGYMKSNDLAEMPAYGQRGQLSDAEIRDVVQYVIKLSGRAAPQQAAENGRQIYMNKGACYDCHTGDGSGNIDYGATDFTANVWDYGGDANSLYESIYYGRHGLMPAYVGKLSLTQIRALAVYVQTASER